LDKSVFCQFVGLEMSALICVAGGGGIETADACIAAVALANGFIVATRDTNPFQAAGLDVINPWHL
jgi:predicted nucleic acid-binding protein